MKTFNQFQESVATAVMGGSKLIPALMTGIGAAGMIMKSKKKDNDGINITPRNLKNLENAVFRDKTGRKLDGEILKRREQKNQMKKGPFADTGGFDASKSRTKRQYLGLPPTDKLSKQQKKDRKISAQREMIRKRDDKLSKEGPGDLVPDAKRERLQKLLRRYNKKNKQ